MYLFQKFHKMTMEVMGKIKQFLTFLAVWI